MKNHQVIAGEKKSAKALLAKMAAADGRFAWLICSTSFFTSKMANVGHKRAISLRDYGYN